MSHRPFNNSLIDGFFRVPIFIVGHILSGQDHISAAQAVIIEVSYSSLIVEIVLTINQK